MVNNSPIGMESSTLMLPIEFDSPARTNPLFVRRPLNRFLERCGEPPLPGCLKNHV